MFSSAHTPAPPSPAPPSPAPPTPAPGGWGPVQGADPEQLRPPQAAGKEEGSRGQRWGPSASTLHPDSPLRLPSSASPPPQPQSPAMRAMNRQRLAWAGPRSRLRVQGAGPGRKADHPQCGQRPPKSPDHPHPCSASSSTDGPTSRPWDRLLALRLPSTRFPLGVPSPGRPPDPTAPRKPLTWGTTASQSLSSQRPQQGVRQGTAGEGEGTGVK